MGFGSRSGHLPCEIKGSVAVIPSSEDCRKVDIGPEEDTASGFQINPLIHYEVVHRTAHRIRVRIPRLKVDEDYGQVLCYLVKRLEGVESVRCQPLAQSLIVEYVRGIDRAEQLETERHLFRAIQQAHQVDLVDLEDPQALRKAPASEPQSVDLLARLGLPAAGLLLGFGAMVGVPLPGLVVGGIILAATRPVYDRAITALFKHGELAIDLLDALAITLHTLEGNFFAPALMLGMVEGGEAIRDITARSSERASLDLLSCLGTETLVERDGQEVKLPIDQVVVGDRVVVYPGDQIPVDGTVLRGSGLVDQCKLTGESIPIARAPGEDVFASTILVDGHLCIQAERIGVETRAGVIASLMKEAPVYDTRASNFATKVANQLVLPTLLASAIVGTVSGDVSRAISILTLDVGTGIRISVPTTILSALTYGARNGVLIRTGRTIEQLAEVDAIVFDKTGTLTEGRARVTEIHVLLPELSSREVLSLAASAEQGLTHPVAEAIIRQAKEQGVSLQPCDEWEYHVGLGVEAQIRGRQVWVGSRRLMVHRGIDLDELHHRYPNLEDGPHSLVYVALENTLAGVILYSDPIRAESSAVVQALHAQGIEVYVLSGDEARVVRAVSHSLGIPPERVYAESFPERKVEVVKALHDSGKTVAFCGDDINDSAALAYADVSISFAGASGIARETADVVLMEDNLTQLETAIAIAQQAMDIVNQNIALVILPNVGAVLAGVFLVINPVLAILINNGSAILAELNGLRPLLGPTGLPDWLQPPARSSAIRSIRSSAAAAEPLDDAEDAERDRPAAASCTPANPQASSDNRAVQARPLGAIAPSVQVPQPADTLESLIQKDLAARLGVSPQTLSRRKRQSTFAQWSRTRDPGRVAWRYSQTEQVFHPVLADTLPFRPGQERGATSRPGHRVAAALAASG
ncbi:heavy metal translocating P-type ATPase [Leptolyngbya sp. O-77]|uniref:heavy metal translocating P-type ATPase n=1 Tax=Leptolyngbya sp. O-77 TaxID=1080068 RepID=UPI00074D483B|nr:heavy metal translocating P-type ATPase [Leptolyngbya sp. O-77]BAU42484.1 putative copper-importing P-type ATPase A [Leptolyngbya sp. O-77]